MKKVFIICTVRGASEEYKANLEKHVAELEDSPHSFLPSGYKVHLPHRDTNQEASGIEICRENMEAIKTADEVHVFYNRKSQGTHFDMGVAFALGKPIRVIENEEFSDGKSFARMLAEWESETTNQQKR